MQMWHTESDIDNIFFFKRTNREKGNRIFSEFLEYMKMVRKFLTTTSNNLPYRAYTRSIL